MQKVEISNFHRTLLAPIVIILAVASLAVLPSKTSALEMSVQTQQLLPPGGSACAPLSAASFTPYIYDGALHSFEFTVSDASYVALFGSVGDTSLSFQRLNRRVDASGSIRIHADIETTLIRGTLPIQVTLLSARTGQPVCLGTVFMSVGSGPVQPTAPVAPKPAVSVRPAVAEDTPEVALPSTSPELTGATSAASATPVVSTMRDTLKNLCASEASAYRLWLILLVLFALVVGAALWAEFPMSVPWARTPERIATLILILLLVLLGFWYLSAACRAAMWMPLVAFLIAILGLLAAFWNHPRVTQLLLAQDSKK